MCTFLSNDNIHSSAQIGSHSIKIIQPYTRIVYDYTKLRLHDKATTQTLAKRVKKKPKPLTQRATIQIAAKSYSLWRAKNKAKSVKIIETNIIKIKSAEEDATALLIFASAGHSLNMHICLWLFGLFVCAVQCCGHLQSAIKINIILSQYVFMANYTFPPKHGAKKSANYKIMEWESSFPLFCVFAYQLCTVNECKIQINTIIGRRVYKIRVISIDWIEPKLKNRACIKSTFLRDDFEVWEEETYIRNIIVKDLPLALLKKYMRIIFNVPHFSPEPPDSCRLVVIKWNFSSL